MVDKGTNTAEEKNAPQGGALVVVPKNNEDLVEEEIDSQILSIIGLEDVFDLTYEEYATLLKEAAVRGRMPSSQMSTEAVELVTNELKRVRGKTGRFKVKRGKVNIDKVMNRRAPSPQRILPQSLAPPEEENETEKVKKFLMGNLPDRLSLIADSLDDINKTLQQQLGIEKKVSETERKEVSKSKKAEREREIEKKDKKKSDEGIKKLKGPVTGFFDAIKRYFGNILAGSIVVGLVNWFQNPANKGAIDKFGNFITDNAPLILGGILALALLPVASTLISLTSAVLTAIGTLISAGNLAKSLLDKLRSKATTPPDQDKLTPPKPSQMQGGSNTGLFYGKNVDPKTGRKLRGGSSISRYNESFSRMIQGKANLGDKLRVGFRDTTYGMRNFLDKANLKLSSSWEFVKGKFSPLVSNKIKQFTPQLRGLGFGAFRALSGILRLIGLGFLIAELKEDWNNKDYYAIIVKLAAYGAGWIVTSLGFLASAALVSTGLGSPAGIALSVVSMAAGAGTDAAIRHFLLKGRKKTQSKDSIGIEPQTPMTSDYVSPFAGARDREALKASKITGNAPITVGEKASNFSQSRGRPHRGRDIAAPSGTGLTVPSNSVITDKGNQPGGYGNYVVFKDASGVEHFYGHMIEPSPLGVGDSVSPGDIIGRVGSTGRSTGPHLHWEVSRVMGEVGRPRQNVIDPIEMGFPAQAPFTGKVEAAQIAQTKPTTPSIPSPTGRSGIGGFVPFPIGGQQQVTSGSSASQPTIPGFSAEDPNNTNIMTIKAIYNLVG